MASLHTTRTVPLCRSHIFIQRIISYALVTLLSVFNSSFAQQYSDSSMSSDAYWQEYYYPNLPSIAQHPDVDKVWYITNQFEYREKHSKSSEGDTFQGLPDTKKMDYESNKRDLGYLEIKSKELMKEIDKNLPLPGLDSSESEEKKLESLNLELERINKLKPRLERSIAAYEVQIQPYSANKKSGFYLSADVGIVHTGVLKKAGEASSESVDNLLGTSSDDSGFSFSIGGQYKFQTRGTYRIRPLVSFAYQQFGGIHFTEDFQIDGGIRVNSERELTGHGVRFGLGADIPFGGSNSWGSSFILGGTYMKNTVDQTRTAIENGREIGSFENSASTSNLNPYAEVKVTYEVGSLEDYMAMRRWSAGGGVRIEKSTLLDDIQGEYSDTTTSIFLELQIPLGKQ